MTSAIIPTPITTGPCHSTRPTPSCNRPVRLTDRTESAPSRCCEIGSPVGWRWPPIVVSSRVLSVIAWFRKPLARQQGTRQRFFTLLQSCVFRLGFFQDGDVGVGIFPEAEELFVGGECPDAGGIGIRALRGFRL